jgi:hypothetical protein
MKCERRIDADSTVVTLEGLVELRGCAPQFIRCDNGPELTANTLRDWCRLPHRDRLHRAWLTVAEPLRRELRLQSPRRATRRRAVLLPRRGQGHGRRLARALQRTPPTLSTRDEDPSPVRPRWRHANPPGDQAARGIALRSPSGLTPRDTAATPGTTRQPNPDHRLSHTVDR